MKNCARYQQRLIACVADTLNTVRGPNAEYAGCGKASPLYFNYILTQARLENTDDINPNASGGFFEMRSLKLIVFTQHLAEKMFNL